MFIYTCKKKKFFISEKVTETKIVLPPRAPPHALRVRVYAWLNKDTLPKHQLPITDMAINKWTQDNKKNVNQFLHLLQQKKFL